MTDPAVVPRLAAQLVADMSEVMPVVVLRGARQVGKSTLANAIAAREGRVVENFDDPQTRARFRANEDGFLRRPEPMVIDEAQREPSVMLALKRAVDAMGTRRVRGKYLVTGSADPLLMRDVADSLPGRAGYVTIWPLTRGERGGVARAGHWSLFLDHPSSAWPALLAEQNGVHAGAPADWRAEVMRGAFPEPSLALGTDAARRTWREQYVSTWLDRDLRELTRIPQALDVLRLMQFASLRLGNLVNQTDLGRDAQLPQPRVARYLNVLEMSYQLVRLPSFGFTRQRRLLKTPKLYWNEAALAMHLAGLREPTGAHFENMILLELLAWAEGGDRPTEIGYWRTSTGHEVDFVIRRGEEALPVEVKTSANVTWKDLKGVRTFLEEHAPRAKAGVVLYAGSEVAWVANNVLAVPWWMVI